MIYKAGCKINLGLSIIEKRPDGYHNLESVFFPVPFYDLVEVVPSSSFSFTTTGLYIDGKEEDNLCVKAYRLMQEKYDLPDVKIHLHKVIPFGAGLGGGSSDAVAILKLLNNLFNLQIKDSGLVNLAATLGSDCPFFVENKPALALGIGVDLQPIELILDGLFLVIIKPNIHISTQKAYGLIQNFSSKDTVLSAVNQSIEFWRDNLINDFEKPLFQEYPALSEIKSKLYQSGAIYAAMSGSGSALFGIFNAKPNLKWVADMECRILAL